MNKQPIKTLVIDDSAYSRRTIADILEASGECTIIGVARDGEDGIKKALELKPELITLDLEMPKMDGFTFLRILMKSLPTPVLVISSMSQQKTVFRAMEMGAVDFLAKPDPQFSQDIYDVKNDLIAKIKVVRQLKMTNVQRRASEVQKMAEHTPVNKPTEHKATSKRGPFECCVIGSSTGGPSALQTIFSTLPGDLPVSIGVSQHMPAGFTRAFAERLDKYSQWEIREARQDDLMVPGRVLICPGGFHMAIRRSGSECRVDIIKRTSSDKYVPSIDVLFKSAPQTYGSAVLGVVLTGMGSDGRDGAKIIKEAGGTVFAESEKTAIVYGMPKEAAAAGAVDQSIPLDLMAQKIADITAPVSQNPGNGKNTAK